MDKEKVLKALAFLDSKNCLKGKDKIWFERLIEDEGETLTLYLENGEMHIASVYNDEDFDYSFDVTVNDIFETILRGLGISWEYV